MNENSFSGDSNIDNSLYHAELRFINKGCFQDQFDNSYTKLSNLTDSPLTEYDLMQENGVLGRIS